MITKNKKGLRQNWRNWSLFEKISIISCVVTIIAGLSSGLVYSYTNWVAPYLKEHKKIANHKSIIESYYYSIENHTFDANTLYNSSVTNYISMKNTTPGEINNYVNFSFYKEFQNPKYEIAKDTYYEESLDNGGCKISFIEFFNCYRNSLKKYQHLKAKTLVLLNSENKILSWQQTDILENTFVK
jgi:hypothetical protein